MEEELQGYADKPAKSAIESVMMRSKGNRMKS